MHEVGLCEDVLAAVLRRADGRQVRVVRVRVGVLHRVAQDAFDQAFSMLSTGTSAQDATVDLVTVPVTAHCRRCGTETEADGLVFNCPDCKGTDLEIVHGDELLLESITVATAG